MTTTPPVYAVILTYNGWQDTVACLASVVALDYPDVTIVISDNGSTDGSVEKLVAWCADQRISCTVMSRAASEQPTATGHGARVVIIENGANIGFGAGNNVGMRFFAAQSSTGYAWLLNNDTVVDRDALRHMVSMAEADPAIGIVGATIVDFDPPHRVQETAGGRITLPPGFVAPNDAGADADSVIGQQRLDYVSGACSLVRRSLLDSVGLIDERFFIYSEDVDWGIRVRNAGYTLAYCRAARIRHRGSATTKSRSPFKDYHIARSLFHLAAKHSQVSIPAVANLVYYLALPKLVRGEWKRLGAVWRAYRDVRADLGRRRYG